MEAAAEEEVAEAAEAAEVAEAAEAAEAAAEAAAPLGAWGGSAVARPARGDTETRAPPLTSKDWEEARSTW